MTGENFLNETENFLKACKKYNVELKLVDGAIAVLGDSKHAQNARRSLDSSKELTAGVIELLRERAAKEQAQAKPQTSQTENNLKIFEFANDKQVRVVINEQDGEPWFVAKDVCEILEFGNYRQALTTHLDEDEKGVQKMDTPGGMQDMSVINESGLYTLVMRSNKPEAKKFRKWVTSEVLPSIRKTGMYATPAKVEDILNNPDVFIETLKAFKAEREKRIELEAKAELDAPKVLFADSVAASETSILIGDLAKLIKQNGVNIGQNKLFEFLRSNGWLISRKGTSYNMPSQKGMERGFFEIKERTINNSDGSIRITRTPKVTGKGQVYFVNLFLHDCRDLEAAI